MDAFFCSQLARHSVPLATVSAIMGHSDVRLTQKFYIDLRINDTKKAVEGVPEIAAATAPTTTSRVGATSR